MKITDNSVTKDSYEDFEQAARIQSEEQYVLKLYVSGMSSRSMQAIENLKRICETELHRRYNLEVIDITQQPELVEKADIIATPTLIKELPKPFRKIIGDLSNAERIYVALNLKPKE